ncbi:MAG: 23S rRNA (pseudouridine(1915)-N(3))-methyltransferase RlmH [Prolixibacteraceae bacterium]|nr:23S rRNA (pseudouridine(1915)-N(3))-methyltransferase RlmH [Prolixibacteraceae bacterium]
MKITLIVIGKTEAEYLVKGISDYFKRINHYLSFNEIVIPALKNTASLSEDIQKQKEGVLILNCLKSTDELILLDEKGEKYTSVSFSEFIRKKMISGTKNMVFCIGGPYGFSEDIYNRSNMKISLSEMTFSHQMVRLIFSEQLYRAMTIIKGEPYHHK